MILLLILAGINKGNAQSNAMYPANQPGGTNCSSVSVGLNANTFANAAAVNNTFVGANAGVTTTTGFGNTYIGQVAGNGNISGSNNVGLGRGALENAISNNNTFNIGIGSNAGVNISSSNNILIGTSCGSGLTTGGSNTFLGSVTVPSSASTPTQSGNNISNTIILADGSGNHRLYINGPNGYAGIGIGTNQIPQNKLEINATGGVAGTSGLRFRNFTNLNYNTAPPTSNRRVLTVNNNGDVILVDDVIGTGTTFTSTCGTTNYLPKSTGANSMVCSQIFDNTSGTIPITSSTVSIGYSTQPVNFNYNSSGNAGQIGAAFNGVVRLDVNGATKGLAFFATSDKKFKKDIKPIENALATVEAIDGKTYLWNRESFKDKNFDEGGHSGFIAQELEKVLPHLVATYENGDKAINYMELMPYLVEAIKEQQTQINDLKAQIDENFKTQNQDLIGLTNTKIISVSPNPSNDVITISFNVEKSVQSASLQVFDLNGNMMSNLKVNDRDTNLTRTLQKDNFGKGIYIVSLVVNGKSIDTKKIVFNSNFPV